MGLQKQCYDFVRDMWLKVLNSGIFYTHILVLLLMFEVWSRGFLISGKFYIHLLVLLSEYVQRTIFFKRRPSSNPRKEGVNVYHIPPIPS